MTNSYQPVNCALHSEYELLAMHRAFVEISAVDEFANPQRLSGRVMDILTRQGAEYLIIIDAENLAHQLRLDRISSIQKIEA